MGTMDMMMSLVTIVGMEEEDLNNMVNMMTSMETFKEEAVKEIMDIMVNMVKSMETLKEEVVKEIMVNMMTSMAGEVEKDDQVDTANMDRMATMMKMMIKGMGMVMVSTMMKNKLKITT